MGNRETVYLCVAASAFILCSAAAWAGNDQGILGRQGPAWSVEKWLNLPPGKQKVDVGDYRGKVLYLFCFQSWCPGCHSSGFPTLQKVMSQFEKEEDVAFVAVQTVFEGFESNTFERAMTVARKYELKIPVGQSGEKGEASHVMERYRSGGTPWVIIIDRDGIVRYNDFHIEASEAGRLIHELLKKPVTKKESTRDPQVTRGTHE